MPRNRENRTYRLRYIPPFVVQPELANFLTTSVEGLGPIDNINVYSLASSLNTRDITKTATLIFKKVPTLFDNDKREWSVHVPGQARNLIFDTHFLDFTALNDVEPSVYQFDCIAISGLGSHPFGSWKERGLDTNFMWLRDSLNKDIPCIKAIIYGYDTEIVESESFQTIDDLALSFITKLRTIKRPSRSLKPLILFAHSLGGIVLKRAMTMMANGSEVESRLLRSMRLVFFFGVPSRGMFTSHLLSMVESQPNKTLINSLSPDSEFLTSLDESFSGVALHRDTRLISAYETKKSRTTQMSELGQWERSGAYEILVDRNSAIQAGSLEPQDVFPINEDHSNMVKLSDGDGTYHAILNYLEDLLESSTVQNLSSAADESRFRTPESKASNTAKPIQPRARHFEQLGCPNVANEEGVADHFFQKPSSETSMSMLAGRHKTNVTSTSKHGLRSRDGRKKDETVEMLHSLSFAETSHRLRDIATAHSTTFDWIFDDDIGFVSWLRDDRSIYWIRGKPGSGKSTLMKFLHNSERTSENIRHWRPRRKQVVAWFFFHERGSYLQKSFEGLLRAILLQIVEEEPELAKLMLPFYLRRPIAERSTWTIGDLEQALLTLLEQKETALDIFLFLDALDEYDGTPEVIADFIDSIVSLCTASHSASRVKICFSSRPWDAFVAKFDKYPGFFMHHKTKTDITAYASSRLMQVESMSRFLAYEQKNDDPEYEAIIPTIIDRAEGVFLWVKLIVDLLLEAGANATLQQLKQILLDLPDKLEDLYKRTIDRLARSHRREAFVMLEIVHRYPEAIPLQDLIMAASCGLQKTIQDCAEALKKGLSEWGTSTESSRRRLKNRCGGLLEMIDDTGLPKVQFMHQTVNDFVGSSDFEHKIFGPHHVPLSENGYTFLLKYELAHLFINGTFPFQQNLSKNYMADHLRQLVIFAHLAEVTTGRSNAQFLDSLNDNIFREHFWPEQDAGLMINSVMSFAVLADLRLYVRQKLKKMGSRIVNDNPEVSLLHCATKSTRLLSAPGNHRLLPPLRDMVQLLLAHKADIHATYNGQTPFQSLFQDCWRMFQKLGRRFTPELVDVAKAFLDSGQDPDIEIRTYDDVECRNEVKCHALHFPNEVLTKALLKKGASVNALDSWGRSPLDISIWNYGNIKPYSNWTPHEAFETSGALLNSGAGITKYGAPDVRHFVAVLQEYLVLPSNFSMIPKLGLSKADSGQPVLAPQRKSRFEDSDDEESHGQIDLMRDEESLQNIRSYAKPPSFWFHANRRTTKPPERTAWGQALVLGEGSIVQPAVQSDAYASKAPQATMERPQQRHVRRYSTHGETFVLELD